MRNIIKPGDLVRLAPNIFNDREVGNTVMLVVYVLDGPGGKWVPPSKLVKTLFKNSLRTYHDGELDIIKSV